MTKTDFPIRHLLKSAIMCIFVAAVVICGAAATVHAETYGDYEYSLNNNEITITGYTGSSMSIDIPANINGYPVTKIGERAFSYKNITSVIIPEGVKRLGDHVFVGCASLRDITIPNGVESIGDYAFVGCEALNNLNIPGTVTSIGTGAFYYCYSLSDITVDAGNPVFDSRNGCNALIRTADDELIVGGDKTVIPNDIKSIGAHAFEEADLETRGLLEYEPNPSLISYNTMKSIVIPDSVTSIGEYAFADCSYLKNINLPSKLTSISDYAFYRSGLKSLTIPDSVTSIGKSAFEGTMISCVTIPENVITVGDFAFAADPDEPSIGVLKRVVILGSETRIGRSAFVLSIGAVIIPNDVASIAKLAFNDGDTNEGVTIYSRKGSKAEAYANKNNIAFYTLPAKVSKLKITLNRGNYNWTAKEFRKVYRGKAITPAAAVCGLVEGTDYKVTYSNNVKVGTAKVTIRGMGDYCSGTVTKTFKIVPKKSSISKLTVGKRKFTVRMGAKPASKGAKSYQIAYRQKGTKKWKYAVTTASYRTVKSLTKGKRYQVKVRAFKTVNKVKYYGAWSKVRLSAKVK